MRQTHGSGGELPYLDEGEGEGVVLLHGLGASSTVWRGIVPALAARMRVIVPDLAGAPGDPRAQAGAVRELLDRLGIRRFAAVGHGVGGVVAELLAIEGGVDCLALIDAGPVDPTRAHDPGPGLDPADLRGIDLPALIVWGEEDRYLPVEVADALAEALPRSSLVLLPGRSHFVLEEAADTIGPLVAEFLRARYLGLAHDHGHAHGHPPPQGPVPIELHRSRGQA